MSNLATRIFNRTKNDNQWRSMFNDKYIQPTGADVVKSVMVGYNKLREYRG